MSADVKVKNVLNKDLKPGDEIHYFSSELIEYDGQITAFSGTVEKVINSDGGVTVIVLEMDRIITAPSNWGRPVAFPDTKDFRQSAMVSTVGSPRTFKGISLE